MSTAQSTNATDWSSHWPNDDHNRVELDTNSLLHLIASDDEGNQHNVSSGQAVQTNDGNGQVDMQNSSDNNQQHPTSLPLAGQMQNAVASSSSSMDTEQMKQHHPETDGTNDMLTLIPIPQAWSHIRHQSGLFSYPDLPHFNIIRQATFRDGRFVCPFCSVDFASKEGIRYHLYNSCTKSPYPKAFFRCLMCGSELADRSSLRTHLARHGGDDGGAASSDALANERKKKTKKKKKGADGNPNMNAVVGAGVGVGGLATVSSPRGGVGYMQNDPHHGTSLASLPIIKSEPMDNEPKVRKRGRPPKMKTNDGTSIQQNFKAPTSSASTPNNPIMSETQLKHIEFATDSLLPEQEQEINIRLRSEGFVHCHRCRGKAQFTNLKKLKEHLKTDCPLGPVMAICKFCGIPFSSVSSVCDHLELYHDDSNDGAQPPDDPCRVNDRAFRAAFARYKFPQVGRIQFSAPSTTIGQLIPENESAACLSNGASCLRVRMLSCDRFLNPLDSFAASHVIVLNVGRPIRCVEWLPRAVDVIGSQYVALALEQWSYDTGAQLHGHGFTGANSAGGNGAPNSDRRSPPGSTLLLILNCGRLRQSLHVPNLHVTVAADFGLVTCLKWLPDRPTINDPYLSYLAIGTSQGIVLIFGVPHGASRNLCTINSGAQLVPPLNRRKDGSVGCAEYGSCTALDWCHDNPNKLCAGYENGIVLMWEVNAKSLVEQASNCALIYPVRRFFVEDTPIQDVKFLRNSEHLIAISLKNKHSWTVWTTRDENIFCYRHWSNSSEFASSPINETLFAGCAHPNNHNEVLSVSVNSILLPGQNVSSHCQHSMPSAWQIVSLDYSEWIDAVSYADLDGTVYVARGDSTTWNQGGAKFRPSVCVAKLSTYLTGTGGATAGNLASDPVGLQQYNQAQSAACGVPTGQYCVQIAIERTEYASSNVDTQHDETHKVHTYRKIRFNPNPGTHSWVASADKVGLFLLFRLSTSDSPLSDKLTQRLQRVQVL
ncbi:unnamed protein product [Didymodactylos carnosus]|uniref:C2H2-type domain-containing protein n=1 Tax=Didymodactylos carnosus TaxID=1234261 RepID=A0A813VAX0_9BILA|nr:unnamed protein product [Didymodactylos carnosus]CAF3622805.1 unnamed protein product [Didymodactylos carnosus]